MYNNWVIKYNRSIINAGRAWIQTQDGQTHDKHPPRFETKGIQANETETYIWNWTNIENSRIMEISAKRTINIHHRRHPKTMLLWTGPCRGLAEKNTKLGLESLKNRISYQAPSPVLVILSPVNIHLKSESNIGNLRFFPAFNRQYHL